MTIPMNDPHHTEQRIKLENELGLERAARAPTDNPMTADEYNKRLREIHEAWPIHDAWFERTYRHKLLELEAGVTAESVLLNGQSAVSSGGGKKGNAERQKRLQGWRDVMEKCCVEILLRDPKASVAAIRTRLWKYPECRKPDDSGELLLNGDDALRKIVASAKARIALNG